MDGIPDIQTYSHPLQYNSGSWSADSEFPNPVKFPGGFLLSTPGALPINFNPTVTSISLIKETS